MKYIRVYDDVITKEFADHLIEKFHANKDEWKIRDEVLYTFNEINLNDSIKIFEPELKALASVYEDMVDKYIRDVGIYDFQFPDSYAFEAFRMKQYPEGVGEFLPHIDAGDFHSAKRFLVFFLYLDAGEGGETILFDQGVAVPRKPGRMIMFPPTWTYPHAGAMPTKNDKHIIGSYLHFKE